MTPDARVVRYAGFWRRFWAWTIDLLVLCLIAGLLSVATGGRDIGALWLGAVAIYLVGLTYEGGTVGKRLLGMRVVRINGERLDLPRAAVREIVRLFISPLPLFLGFLWMLDDADRQTWHDAAAGSVVVRELPATVAPPWADAPPWRT